MLRPTSEAELSEIVRTTKAPIRIQGGGTRMIGRCDNAAGLTTSGISGITDYEPGALTLVAKAGTSMAEIEAALDAEGQILAFEPMDYRSLLHSPGTPTIGGVVAANVSGPRRVVAGACRDFLMGVRFVDGEGHILKNGGRVMKNVTGYDLCKLMCGAYGSLGVLTEVSFKVLPAPEKSVTLTLPNLSGHQALEAMAAAITSPYEVNGYHYGPYGTNAPLFLRLEGMEMSVKYRVERVKDLLRSFGVVELSHDGDESNALWRGYRDMTALSDSSYVVRCSVRPSNAAQLLDELSASYDVTAFLDWGGGLVWIGADAPSASSLHADIQRIIARIGGHAKLIKAPDTEGKALAHFQPDSPLVASISAGLRQKFDPRGFLNPGVMG